ncbi:MAG: hypothetical protein M1821_001268 [Bathelium mastoideum]|nr:MAG: hypothetical protein M1821_001268 [Bathelium mastoideum]
MDGQGTTNEAESETSGTSPTRIGKSSHTSNKTPSMHCTSDHPETDVASTDDISAKSTEHSPVPRSSPKPILGRQTLPKPTFSSFEEYEDDLLTRPVCTARPSEENMFPHEKMVHSIYANIRQHEKVDTTLQPASQEDASVPDTSSVGPEEGRTDQGASPSITESKSGIQQKATKEFPQGQPSDQFLIACHTQFEETLSIKVNRTHAEPWEKDTLHRLANQVNGNGEVSASAPRFREKAPRGLPMPASSALDRHTYLKSPSAGYFNHNTGEWCSNDPASKMLSFPEMSSRELPLVDQVLLDSAISSKVCEPLTSGMSPPSSLDDIVDGPFRRDIKPSYPVNGSAASTLSAIHFSDPVSRNDARAPDISQQKRISGPDLSKSLIFCRRRRVGRPEASEEEEVLVSRRGNPKTMRSIRSINLCAGNSAELCSLVSDSSAEDIQGKSDNKHGRETSMDPNDGPFLFLSTNTAPGIDKLAAKQTEPDFPIPPLPGRPHSVSPIRSKIDFEDFFVDDDIASLPPGDRYEAPKRPNIKPIMLAHKPETRTTKCDTFSVEKLLRKRKFLILPDYGAGGPRDRTTRGLRQIEQADHVVATVFSKALGKYKSFRPVKLHWQHGKWVWKGQDALEVSRGKEKPVENQEFGLTMPSKPVVKSSNALDEDEMKRDSIFG